MDKLLVVTGPTAAGKTELGIKLARKFAGEILSADSRQVYKYMDIGTGKERDLYQKASVPVWGIDLVAPDYEFNASEYVLYARDKIKSIWERGGLPIIVGGTGLYIKELLDPSETLHIPPDQKLRDALSGQSLSTLQKELQELNRDRWDKMNQSDRNNPRRLIRAIEIASTGHKKSEANKDILQPNNVLIIGLTASLTHLYKRIDKRVEARVKQGIIKETQGLLEKGYTWDLPSMSGMGYKEFKDFFLQPTTYNLTTATEKWRYDEHAYARRQITYLKKFLTHMKGKGAKVLWFDITTNNYKGLIMSQVSKWYDVDRGKAKNQTGN